MSDSEDNRETAISFPCEFPIKVLGKSNLEFQGAVLEVFRKHVPSLGESAIEMHYSKENKYLSMTVTFTADSQKQLDAIYQDLTHNSHILMVF